MTQSPTDWPTVLRADAQFPPGFQATLTEEERVSSLWWEGSFDYRERIFLTAVLILAVKTLIDFF